MFFVAVALVTLGSYSFLSTFPYAINKRTEENILLVIVNRTFMYKRTGDNKIFIYILIIFVEIYFSLGVRSYGGRWRLKP